MLLNKKIPINEVKPSYAIADIFKLNDTSPYFLLVITLLQKVSDMTYLIKILKISFCTGDFVYSH